MKRSCSLGDVPPVLLVSVQFCGTSHSEPPFINLKIRWYSRRKLYKINTLDKVLKYLVTPCLIIYYDTAIIADTI
jgi:hypothetical protein